MVKEKKNKYYCLLLNEANDKVKHYISNGKEISVLDGITKANLTSFENYEDHFFELDYKITIDEDYWIVEGSFPVIATIEDGKMVDVITGEEIEYAKKGSKTPNVSYYNAVEAVPQLAEFMLESLTPGEKERYEHKLFNIAKRTLMNYLGLEVKDQYYYLFPTQLTEQMPEMIIGCRKQGSNLKHSLTEEVFEYEEDNVITNRLTYNNYQKITKESAEIWDTPRIKKEELTEALLAAKRKQQVAYNNYVSMNKSKNFATKIKKIKTKEN